LAARVASATQLAQDGADQKDQKHS
jgi:hypothetical protein